MESNLGNKLWGTLQARLDCSALLHRGHRHSARLLRSLKQLERRKWDLDALVGRPVETLMTRAAQADRHAGLTGKWRWVWRSWVQTSCHNPFCASPIQRDRQLPSETK